MNAGERFKAGKLHDAIDAQVAEVKAHPGDHAKRLFLFELLAFAGELERARRQIEALDYSEPELVAAVQAYRKLLDSEQLRRRLFNDGHPPEHLAPFPEHAKLRLAALAHLRGHRPEEAVRVLEKASAATPPIRATINGKAVQTVRDCDDLFGGVLEVMSQGKYFWLSLEQVHSLTMNPPKYPRDLIWFPAHLEVRDGPAGDVFLPALYPNSHAHPDDQVKLGRMTDWQSEAGGPVLGVGARTFLLDDEATPLLEWRSFVGEP